MQILSPAKINLRLKIEGRRDDGFHFLSMLNIFCDFCDEIEFNFINEPGINIEASPAGILPNSEKNFALIAAKKFYEKFGIAGGLSIKLIKNIPLGSGLGGGSSNAGFILRTLLRKFGGEILKREKYSKQEIITAVREIAAEIGSDVPFFLSQGTAKVGGVGEKVEDIELAYLENVSFLLILPGESVSTELVYADLRKIPPEKFKKDTLLEKNILTYEGLINSIENDLQDITARRSSLVRETLSSLNELNNFKACMSGSGSAIFMFNRHNPAISSGDIEDIKNHLKSFDLAIRETRFYKPESRLDNL
jgi:4-diphosphocytidyl-2-C-methyl-D-erythritol kinase